MKHLIPIIITLYCLPSFAQVPEDFPRLPEGCFDNGSIKTERTFTSESLFGYMNGGAELYLEYGFDRLVVSEIEAGNTEFKVEIYRMKNPEAAFGIYSVSVFRCDTSGHISDYSCQTDYQLQFCKGYYYVNIVNNTGSRQAVIQSAELADRLAPLITEQSFSVAGFINDLSFDEEITKYTLIKGELGLFNGAYEWNDILEDIEGYTALVAETDNRSILIIEFVNDISRVKFLESVGIRSLPTVDEEISVDQNTSLAIRDDNVIVLTRDR